MKAKTRQLTEEMGTEKSKQQFLYFESGIYPLRPDGLNDITHLSQPGAFTIDRLMVKGMKESDIPLAKFLVNFLYSNVKA